MAEAEARRAFLADDISGVRKAYSVVSLQKRVQALFVEADECAALSTGNIALCSEGASGITSNDNDPWPRGNCADRLLDGADGWGPSHGLHVEGPDGWLEISLGGSPRTISAITVNQCDGYISQSYKIEAVTSSGAILPVVAYDGGVAREQSFTLPSALDGISAVRLSITGPTFHDEWWRLSGVEVMSPIAQSDLPTGNIALCSEGASGITSNDNDPWPRGNCADRLLDGADGWGPSHGLHVEGPDGWLEISLGGSPRTISAITVNQCDGYISQSYKIEAVTSSGAILPVVAYDGGVAREQSFTLPSALDDISAVRLSITGPTFHDEWWRLSGVEVVSPIAPTEAPTDLPVGKTVELLKLLRSAFDVDASGNDFPEFVSSLLSGALAKEVIPTGGCVDGSPCKVFEHAYIPVAKDGILKMVSTDAGCCDPTCGTFEPAPDELTQASVSVAWNAKQASDQSAYPPSKLKRSFQLSGVTFGPSERFLWDPARKYELSLQGDIATTGQLGVPVPCYQGNQDGGNADQGGICFSLAHLPPTDCIRLDFTGIHGEEGYYIGVNAIRLLGPYGEQIPWVCIAADGSPGKPIAFTEPSQIEGWWAVSGDVHSLVFQLYGCCSVSSLELYCANMAATPEMVTVTSAPKPMSSDLWATDCCFQLNGTAIESADHLMFNACGLTACSPPELVAHLNNNPSRYEHGFASFVDSTKQYAFVYYRRGKLKAAFDYFIGITPLSIEAGAADTFDCSNFFHHGARIEKVEERAMKLSELRIVRAIIVSQCFPRQWKSSWDQHELSPETVNLYDFNAEVIMPLTKETNCAFKELFPSGAEAPRLYTSHWWGENVLDFIRCCEEYARMRQLDDPSFWVCAYCNRQHDLGSDLGSNPDDSSFRRAMLLAESVLVIMDPAGNVLTRIWVDYEVYRTIVIRGFDFTTFKCGLPHLLAAEKIPGETAFQKTYRESSFPGKLLAKGLESKLQHGNVTEHIDKVRILNVMVDNPVEQLDDDSVFQRLETQLPADEYAKDLEYYNIANDALHAQYALKAWPVALATDSLGDFYGHDLAATVKKDARLQVVRLDFTCSKKMNDHELLRVSQALPPQIEALNIGLCGCTNVTDAGISQFKMPSGLKNIKIGLSNLSFSQATWINFFKEIFPKNAESIKIEISSSQNTAGILQGDNGDQLLIAIAGCFSKHLTTLDLLANHGFPEATDAGYIAFAELLPRGLTRLHIEIGNSKNTELSVLHEFVSAAPSTIEDLLIVRKGEKAREDDLRALWDVLKGWPNLHSFSFKQMVTRGPEMLTGVALDIEEARKRWGS